MGYLRGDEERLINIISGIRVPDKDAMEKCRERWLNVAKPLFSLGRFEDIIIKIAGITGSEKISVDKKALIIMCADNGVVAEGITQTGSSMTKTVTENFLSGETSVSKMAGKAGVDVFPVDIGVMEDIPGLTDNSTKVRRGTGNIVRGEAMTRPEAVKALLVGIELVKGLKDEGYEIIATGEMGIGNTTTASAVTSVLLSKDPDEMTGPGAGLDEKRLEKKKRVIRQAIQKNSPDPADPVDVLHKVGGLDIAGLAGVFLGGAAYGVPIVIDGFISAAGALIANKLCERTADYMIPSHASKEPAEELVLKTLSLECVIHGEMFLGEGTGAVMLFPLLDMALSVYNEMVTFDELKGHSRYEVF